VSATVPAGAGPLGMALDPSGHTLWIANENEPDLHRALTALDTTTLTASDVDLGPAAPTVGGPASFAITPDGHRLLIGRFASDSNPHPSLVVLDTATRTPVGTLTMPTAFRLATTPDNHHAYATSGDLWSIDLP